MKLTAVNYSGKRLIEEAFLNAFFTELESVFAAKAEIIIFKVCVRPPYPSELTYKLRGEFHTIQRVSQRADIDVMAHFRMLCGLSIEAVPRQTGQFTALFENQSISVCVEILAQEDHQILKLKLPSDGTLVKEVD